MRPGDDERKEHVGDEYSSGVPRWCNPPVVLGPAAPLEVLVAGEWVEITHFPPADIGMTDEDVAETVRLLRYQSGVDIPDDISGLHRPAPVGGALRASARKEVRGVATRRTP